MKSVLTKMRIRRIDPLRAAAAVVSLVVVPGFVPARQDFDIMVAGVSVLATQNQLPTTPVETGVAGREYYLSCGFTATGSEGPASVPFRFLVGGQVVHEVLAPVQTGQYLPMGAFWTPPSAGTYTLVCEANPEEAFPETTFANNQRTKAFSVEVGPPEVLLDAGAVEAGAMQAQQEMKAVPPAGRGGVPPVSPAAGGQPKMGIQGELAVQAPALPVPTGPNITSTTPAKMLAGKPPSQLRLHGTGLVPEGATYDMLPIVVHVLMRDGPSGSFVEAPLVIPSTLGWGATGLTVNIPAGVGSSVGSLQIKIVVATQESSVYSLPVLPKPPAAPVQITSVSPSETALGSTSYYFILRVYGTGISAQTQTRPWFQGIELPYSQFLYGNLDDYVQFSVPQQFRNQPGSYTIQLRNNLGNSNIEWWQLVVKPEITSVSPATIQSSFLEPGAPPVTMTIGYGTSPPKKVMARMDGGAWSELAQKGFQGYTVRVALPLATLAPKKSVEIKLVNKAGESAVRTLPVPPSMILQDAAQAAMGITGEAGAPPAPVAAEGMDAGALAPAAPMPAKPAPARAAPAPAPPQPPPVRAAPDPNAGISRPPKTERPPVRVPTPPSDGVKEMPPQGRS